MSDRVLARPPGRAARTPRGQWVYDEFPADAEDERLGREGERRDDRLDPSRPDLQRMPPPSEERGRDMMVVPDEVEGLPAGCRMREGDVVLPMAR
jgi:hypothetical protein